MVYQKIVADSLTYRIMVGLSSSFRSAIFYSCTRNIAAPILIYARHNILSSASYGFFTEVFNMCRKHAGLIIAGWLLCSAIFYVIFIAFTKLI